MTKATFERSDLDPYMITEFVNALDKIVNAGPGTGWMQHALCVKNSRNYTDHWPEPGTGLKPHILAECRACPVRRDCLMYAYRLHFKRGWFGGFSPKERKTHSLAELLKQVDAAAHLPPK